MKATRYLSIFLSVILLISCSSDDNGNDNNDNEPLNASLYFPLFANSYWTYINTTDQGNTSDSLFVKGTQNQNSNTYTDLDAKIPATAFMTTLLSQNLVRTNISEFILFGELGAPSVEGFPEISIPLDDVVLFDVEASANTTLSLFSGELEEVINEFPIVIDYTIRTEQKEKLENYTVNEQSYNDVIKSMIFVNLAITAEIEILPGVILPVPILSSQDVMIATNYYAANTGLISSDVLTQYELEDLSGTGIVLPFPSEASSNALQWIDLYVIGN